MFAFGHLGFGRLLARPFACVGPTTPLLIGALLPDLFDKSLFYFSPWHMHGTRTLGHTLVFLGAITLINRVKRSRWGAAACLGVATHLVVDNIGDLLHTDDSIPRNLQILLWPMRGWAFPETLHLSLHEQMFRMKDPYFLTTEIIGIVLLIYFTLRDRRAIGRGAAK